MQSKGFTLLEILIVLIIISILSAVAVLNINAPSYSTFIAESFKIASMFTILNDDAVYSNSVISCKVLGAGVSCQSYKNGEWKALSIAKLTNWEWPQNFTIEKVYVDGNELKNNDQIRFFPSTELSNISIQITNGKYHTWIDGDSSGNFKINN